MNFGRASILSLSAEASARADAGRTSVVRHDQAPSCPRLDSRGTGKALIV